MVNLSQSKVSPLHQIFQLVVSGVRVRQVLMVLTVVTVVTVVMAM
jgi:hypothetical protein